jgi:hypothetical protein
MDRNIQTKDFIRVLPWSNKIDAAAQGFIFGI